MGLLTRLANSAIAVLGPDGGCIEDEDDDVVGGHQEELAEDDAAFSPDKNTSPLCMPNSTVLLPLLFIDFLVGVEISSSDSSPDLDLFVPLMGNPLVLLPGLIVLLDDEGKRGVVVAAVVAFLDGDDVEAAVVDILILFLLAPA